MNDIKIRKPLRIYRKGAVDDVTTEIQAWRVVENGKPGTELFIQQSRYDHFKNKYMPSRLITLTLDDDQRQTLIDMLLTG